MRRLNRFDRLFIITALLIQVALVVSFALRKWNFPAAMQFKNGGAAQGTSVVERIHGGQGPR